MITYWNGGKLLRENLPRVVEASKNSENRIKEIIVVDDASTDDSVVFLKKNYPDIRVVVHEQNKGYSATCNTGVKEASSVLVVILNLDVIPEKDFLVNALPHFEDEKVFAVSLNEGKYGPGRLKWKNGFWEIIPNDIKTEVTLADWASGGSSLFRKSIWEGLGGMDEIYLPFYFEDIDLGIKATKAGFLCLWEPKAKVRHQHEATINSNNFSKEYIETIKERNHLLLTWRNIDSPKLFFNHLSFLLRRLLTTPGYLKIVFLALFRKISYKSCKINKK